MFYFYYCAHYYSLRFNYRNDIYILDDSKCLNNVSLTLLEGWMHKCWQKKKIKCSIQIIAVCKVDLSLKKKHVINASRHICNVDLTYVTKERVKSAYIKREYTILIKPRPKSRRKKQEIKENPLFLLLLLRWILQTMQV